MVGFTRLSPISFCSVYLTVFYNEIVASTEDWFNLISSMSCKMVRIDVFTKLQLKLADSISSWVIHLLCFQGNGALTSQDIQPVLRWAESTVTTQRGEGCLYVYFFMIIFQQNSRSVQTPRSSPVICNLIPPVPLSKCMCVFLCIDLSPQEEGELIIEGLLNIFWGLRRPIRLQMQDDHERIRPPPSSTSWHSGCNLDSQG